MRELLVVYLKGFAMGAADVVPGVSGGTVALIVGIYDRLIRALTAIDPRAFRPALRLHRPDGRARLAAVLERTDAFFLFALGLGVVSAVVALSGPLHAAVTGYPTATYGFFFGLIAASAVVLYGEVDAWTPSRLAVAAAGVAIAAWVAGATAGDAAHGLAMVFLAGAVAVCAMVLPGVSGAFFLIVLGQYEYLTGTLSSFVDGVVGLLEGGSIGPVVDLGTVVGVFVAGAAVGLFTMAHLVRRALDRWRAATLAFLVSLMVGGLRMPGAEILATADGAGGLGVAALAGLVGCLAVLLVDRYTDDLAYAADGTGPAPAGRAD